MYVENISHDWHDNSFLKQHSINFHLEKSNNNMNKLVAVIFFFGISVGSIRGKSSKKGLCIPPGTNFHCGDLAAFDNVRYLLVSGFMQQTFIRSSFVVGGITGT